MRGKEARAAEGLLDPILVSRIRSLSLRARLVVEGFIAGMHRSPYHGFSAEFREHRAYQPSDPPRLVDWRLFARSDRLYVKQFTDETNLRAYLLVDSSASMAYKGNGPVSKIDYARSLAASLALLLLKQRDAVGLAIFGDSLQSWVRPSTSSGHLERLLIELVRAEPRGGTRPLEVFVNIAGRIPPRGMVILISDLLVPSDVLVTALRHLASGKHELLVMRILDRTERVLADTGIVTLKDMETGENLTTRPSLIRKAYATALAEAWRVLEDGLGRFRAHLVDIDTSDDFSTALAAFLSSRTRMR